MKHPSIAKRAVPRSGSGLVAILLGTAGLAACGGGGNAAGSAAGPPAVPVEAVTSSRSTRWSRPPSSSGP